MPRFGGRGRAGASAQSDTYERVAVTSAARGLRVSKMHEAFQSGHGYSLVSSGTLTSDAVDFMFGSGSLKLVTAGTGTNGQARKSGYTAIDFTGKNPVVWIKVDDLTNLSELSVLLYSSAFTDFFKWSIDELGTARFPIAGEWTAVTLPWSKVASTGGTPNRTAIIGFGFRVNDNAAGQVTARINGIGSVAEPASGCVSFTFDDCWDSEYVYARPKLARYGWAATSYVIAELIGNAGRLSEAQMVEMRDRYGWEFGGHSYAAASHTATFTGLSADALDADLRSLRNWLRDRGFTRGAEHLAYPGGQFNRDVINAVRKYFASARSTIAFEAESYPVADPYRLRVAQVLNTTTPADVQTWATAANTNKEWLILVVHKIVTGSAASGEYLDTDFDTLLSNVNGVGIPVRPVGDVLRYGL